MFTEVKTAVGFIGHIASLTGVIPHYQVQKLTEYLEKILYSKFEKHWFPNKPFQGSAFRCIRITQRHMDSEIEKAAQHAKIDISDIRKSLPQELTMWIDPEEVSYRIGEEGSICELLIDSIDNESNESLEKMLLNKSCHSEVPKQNLVTQSNDSPYTQCWS